jgi:hypothetical protein
MECECGHGLDSHGDRALPPACESDRGKEPLHRVVEGMLLIDVPRFRPETACSCEGFKSA